VGICQYDEQTSLCTGCNRSDEEITAWKDMSEAEKKKLYRELPKRREECGFGYAILPWKPDQVLDFLTQALSDNVCAWSVGAYGALGEFSREKSEEAKIEKGDDGATIETERGALKIDLFRPFKPLALLSKAGKPVALALSAFKTKYDRMAPLGLCETGIDRSAIREQDRELPLFNLALGHPHTDFQIRTSQTDLLASLRDSLGTSFFDNRQLVDTVKKVSPHRIVSSPLGRIEVYQPIPRKNGKTPSGPHTHLDPKKIATGLFHEFGEAIPPAYRVGLSLHFNGSGLADELPL